MRYPSNQWILRDCEDIQLGFTMYEEEEKSLALFLPV